MRQLGTLFKLLCAAAARGDTDMMRYLYDQGAVDTFGDALFSVIRNNRLGALKWILDRFPRSEHMPDYSVLVEAARYGRVEMLEYLQSPDSSAECHSTDTMDEAAASGFLETVQWLHANRSEGCTANAIDYATRNGHVEVVEWLHENRADAFTSSAIGNAACAGNVELVQWLHTKGSSVKSVDAMNLAAHGGHLEMMKWLRANRPGECTGEAIVYALCQSHLRAAYWLHNEFPEYSPVLGDRHICGEHKFEVFLFLHTYYPALFTPEVVRKIKSSLLYDEYTAAWLEENYFSPQLTRLN